MAERKKRERKPAGSGPIVANMLNVGAKKADFV